MLVLRISLLRVRVRGLGLGWDRVWGRVRVGILHAEHLGLDGELPGKSSAEVEVVLDLAGGGR